MSEFASLIAEMDNAISSLEVEKSRLIAVRAVLVEAPPVEAPEPTIVVLPPVERRSFSRMRVAAIDDVLALVATGTTRLSLIARMLDASHASVAKRLRELEQQGMAKHTENGWEPTFSARNLNWVEFRARELAS